MRDANIAVLAAPAGAGQTGPAVRRADGVRARDRHALSGSCGVELRTCRLVISPPVIAPMMVMVMPKRSAHPIARSAKRCRHSATATAAVASVCAKIADAHDGEEHSVDERADVEVAGRAAPRLDVDDDDLEQQGDSRDPADDPARRRPLGQVGEHPRERERVDGDRGGELRGLHPRWRARHLARIDEQRHAGGGEQREHERVPTAVSRASVSQRVCSIVL